MNETTASAPGASLIPDGVATITTMHFVFMAIVAAFAIAVILVGIRRKRIRKHAERTVERNAEEAGVPMVEPDRAPEEEAPPPAAPTPSPAAPSPAPAPVTQADEPLPERPLADEPVAAAAPMDATPASIAADAPTPSPPAATPEEQPIALLKGLGPKIQQRLGELGVTTVGQIAALDDAQAAALDAQLGPFAGRMQRDRWREQARLLAAGDRAGFEAAFGRL